MSNILNGNLFGTSFAQGGRRSAGLFSLLAESPVLSAGVATVDLAEVAPQHNTDDPNNRHLFKNYPGEIVRKIRTDTPERPNNTNAYENLGTLHLRLSQSITAKYCHYWDDIIDYDTVIQVLYATTSTIYRSDYWSGGDDQHYNTVTLWYSVYVEPDPPDDPYWQIFESTMTRNIDEEVAEITSSSTYTSPTPVTTGVPSLFNDSTSPGGTPMTPNKLYASFSGLASYNDLLGSGSPDFTLTSDFLMRHKDQAAMGLSAYPVATAKTADLPAWNYTGSVVDFPKVWLSETPYTYTPDDSTWVGSLQAAQVKVKAQFRYTSPGSCDRRWFKGTEIKVKVRYKKAEVIRTFGTVDDIGGYIPSFGSWEDAGEVEKTISLPAYSATPQLIGESWDLPEVDGYAVAVDDIEITKVT